MISLKYYEETFRTNRAKLIEVKRLVLNDLDELSRKSTDAFERNDLVALQKSVHKVRVTLTNIRAFELLRLLEQLYKLDENMGEQSVLQKELQSVIEDVQAWKV